LRVATFGGGGGAGDLRRGFKRGSSHEGTRLAEALFIICDLL